MESNPLPEMIEATLQMATRTGSYLARPVEREFLTKALEKGITIDLARNALLEAGRAKGVVLESAILRDARHNLAQLAGSGNRVSETEFLGIVREAVERAQGHMSDRLVQSILLDILDDNEYPVKANFFQSSWVEKLRKGINAG